MVRGREGSKSASRAETPEVRGVVVVGESVVVVVVGRGMELESKDGGARCGCAA